MLYIYLDWIIECCEFGLQLEQNITSVNLQEMAAILNNTAVQVQQFEPNVSRLKCYYSLSP